MAANKDLLECRTCYAAVARDAYMGHERWHKNQTTIIELTVQNLEGSLNLIQRMMGLNSR